MQAHISLQACWTLLVLQYFAHSEFPDSIECCFVRIHEIALCGAEFPHAAADEGDDIISSDVMVDVSRWWPTPHDANRCPPATRTDALPMPPIRAKLLGTANDDSGCPPDAPDSG